MVSKCVLSRHQRCSIEKAVLRTFAKFTGKHLCQSLFFNKVAGLRPEDTLAQVFSCEFCEISMNTFCYRTNQVAASGFCKETIKSTEVQPQNVLILLYLTLSWRRPLSYRNQSANQWTGFYMITGSVMKELTLHYLLPLARSC